MANIAGFYTSLLNEVSAIGAFPFVRIWNNQLEQLEDGTTYAFPFPNAFVEVLVPADYLPLGGGYSISDVTVRIHIGHDEYDAGGGNFEQNVNVFSYRDQVISRLNGFQPTGGSSLMKSAELQDYAHTNVYHYIIDFKGSFIDSVGSHIDEGVEGSIEQIVFEPPIRLVNSISGQKNEDYREYKIN